MDEAKIGDSKTGDGETKLQSQQSSYPSPIHETRLAALRRTDAVLQGGFTATSGRTSPTRLLQRSNSTTAGSSPGSSARSDLQPSWPHSPRSRSPRPSTPEGLLSSTETALKASPRLRSSSRRSGAFSRKGSRRLLVGKRGAAAVICFALLFLWFALEWWYLSGFQERRVAVPVTDSESDSQADRKFAPDDGPTVKPAAGLIERLLALAAHGLAENELKPEPKGLWEPEAPPQNGATWLPCANQRPQGEHIPPPLPQGSTGHIVINAKGDLGEQRIAICDGVAVARMLNATLVLPRFVLSSESRHSSWFKDLYMEDYFIDYLKEDVRIVKELPIELQSRLDLDAIEAVVTQDDVPKEANPSFYLKHILPLLLKTQVVLFEGFRNRLGFNSIPPDIQTLRCRCNFHALKFTPELQGTGNVIAERMRDRHPRWGPSDDEFQADEKPRARVQSVAKNAPKYLAVHALLETDAVTAASSSGSQCETQSVEELRAYVEEHLNPLLESLDQDGKLGLSELQEELGVCPLMLEESIVILAALGFRRATRIYLAGANIRNGIQAKIMARLKFLFPNLVTKEDLLSTEELQPFQNHSTQLEVLDYMSCTSANAFVTTDSSSKLASMMIGHRIYHSSGHAPTIFSKNTRLTALLRNNATIEWSSFEEKVRKAFIETKHVHVHPNDKNIYRHPRSLECMCEHHV